MEQTHRQRGSTHERLAYARSLWVQEPTIPIDGPTGMIRKLYDRYGESAAPGALETIRREARGIRAREGLKATTNVGAKIVEAQAARLVAVPPPPPIAPPAPAPAPPTKPKPKQPTLPEGWKTTDRINERREFARGVFMQRPDIGLSGRDGLRDMLLSRFGVGVSSVELERIRAEVKQARTGTPAPAAPTVAPTPEAEPEQVRAVDINEVLGTISAMALESIPSLHKLTIEVAPDGSVSIGYTVRETRVVEQSGSLTIRGRS